MLHLLAKLPDWFESVFDKRATANHDTGLPFHADSERMIMTAGAEAILVKRSAGDEG